MDNTEMQRRIDAAFEFGGRMVERPDRFPDEAVLFLMNPAEVASVLTKERLRMPAKLEAHDYPTRRAEMREGCSNIGTFVAGCDLERRSTHHGAWPSARRAHSMNRAASRRTRSAWAREADTPRYPNVERRSRSRFRTSLCAPSPIERTTSRWSRIASR